MKKAGLFFLLTLLLLPAPAVRAAGTTYYVSSSGGNDDYDGLSVETPFRTIAKVNSLTLQPGDQVLFRCGDAWRAEQLVLSESGTESDPILFSSYPAGCANKPVVSGSQPIVGWSVYSGPIYVADLAAGENTARFPMGLNQLFRDGQRLLLGRWPNLDAGSGGYSFVDSHVAGSNQFVDNELPAIDWTGAIVHLKNIRWSMIDRQVTATTGNTLTVNRGFSCLISDWTTCAGWGYFINSHLGTLDQDGEWYYDAAAQKVYLYSAAGLPANIEGSVIQEQGTTLRHGGIMVSDGADTAYVVVDNFVVQNWFNHGIGSPGGMNAGIYHHLTFRNITIKDVDAAGVNLSSWLENPPDGRKGLRGGHDMVFSNNVIDGANHFGISGYFATSTFEDNQIRNIALIKNLNKSGMGCAVDWDECTENGDGLRIRCYDAQDSGYGNVLRYNRFERIGYNGVDVFGPDNTLEKNVIVQSCYSKADCGGVRTFGGDSLATTEVYNIHLIDNVIVDIPGNVDGCHPSRAAFGMGLYVDNYSRDVESRGNTVVSTTITGINYGRSTGQIISNTVYNASYGTEYSAHISLGSESQASLSNNVLYGLGTQAWTVYAYDLSNFTSSDYNYLFHPYVDEHIAYGPSWTRYDFAGWQAFSGLEGHSKTNWFTQGAGEAPRSRIFYNDTKAPKTVGLGARKYLTLDQVAVWGSITLQPFTSIVLVDSGETVLTLSDMLPRMFEAGAAADFTLTVRGVGFTANSVVRWNGAARPTTLVSGTEMTAAISAADVSAVAVIPVTVYDAGSTPSETSPLMFYVVDSITEVHLPLVFK